MKKRNKQIRVLTVLICLLPIILGILFYHKLPEQMPIHFTIKNIPDNYAPKNFALFGLPIIMALVQAICMLIMQSRFKDEEEPKVIKILEWVIPILGGLIYILMIEFSLGSIVYIGKSVCFILGTLFILLGNYFPKMSYEVGKNIFHPTPKSEKSFRKTTKIMGYSFVILGILFFIFIIFLK